MKYYLKNIENNEFHAGNKAREDCEKIFKNLEFKELRIKNNQIVKENIFGKVQKIYCLFKNINTYIKSYIKLKKGDLVFYQFPFNNICERMLIKIISRKKIKLIPVIHDLDGIREKNLKKNNQERKYLRKSYKIISHNKRMTKFLRKEYEINGVIKELLIFDYILNKEKRIKKSKKEDNIICYAGNLDYKKSSFIYKLNELKNVEFNIFGINYQEKKNNNCFKYCGAFAPDIIHEKLNGKYGLIWDGHSLETCEGLYGEYLIYNNPHKFSLYVVAELPVITWDQAAISSYIIENKLGIVVSSLKELNEKLNYISEEEYNIMKKNVIKLKNKIKNGEVLKNLLKEIVKEEKNEK